MFFERFIVKYLRDRPEWSIFVSTKEVITITHKTKIMKTLAQLVSDKESNVNALNIVLADKDNFSQANDVINALCDKINAIDKELENLRVSYKCKKETLEIVDKLGNKEEISNLKSQISKIDVAIALGKILNYEDLLDASKDIDLLSKVWSDAQQAYGYSKITRKELNAIQSAVVSTDPNHFTA